MNRVMNWLRVVSFPFVKESSSPLKSVGETSQGQEGRSPDAGVFPTSPAGPGQFRVSQRMQTP